VRDWYLPGATDDVLDEGLEGLRAIDGCPAVPYDRSRRILAALQNFTSDVIGRFCGAGQQATFAAAPGPIRRCATDPVVPGETLLVVAVAKAIAAHDAVAAGERVGAVERQRALLARLRDGCLACREHSVDGVCLDDVGAGCADTGRVRALVD